MARVALRPGHAQVMWLLRFARDTDIATCVPRTRCGMQWRTADPGPLRRTASSVTRNR